MKINDLDGITIQISDANTESKLFIPYDYELDEPTSGEFMSKEILYFVAQWLANHRYIPTLDNKSMLTREAD